MDNMYRYQGAYSEWEEETGWNDFELRTYDAQIGRWTGVDPYDQYFSPYIGMGNNPHVLNDPTGGFTLDWLSYQNSAGNSVVEWADEVTDIQSANDYVLSKGGKNSNYIGKTGFWESNEFGYQKWLLMEGKNNFIDVTNWPTAPSLKAENVNATTSAPTYVQQFYESSNIMSSIGLPGASIIYDLINSNYIGVKQLTGRKNSYLTDLNGDLVGSKERIGNGLAVLSIPLTAGLPIGEVFSGANAAAKGGSNVKYLGRMEDLKGVPKNQTILVDLPNLGSLKANYYQNMSVIRRHLREGVTFKDASSLRPNSELAPTITWPTRTIRQTFYGAERNLMQNRGLWPK